MAGEEEGGVAVESQIASEEINANVDSPTVEVAAAEPAKEDTANNKPQSQDDFYEKTALQRAVAEENPDFDSIRGLIESEGVGERDKAGRTALHYSKNEEVTQMLIDAGSDIDAKDKHGWTPLHYSMANGEHHPNPEVTKTLIENGADVNAKDSYNLTPLHVACGMSISTGKVREELDEIIAEETADGTSPEEIAKLEKERDDKIAAEGG